jgi:hypothetical protein
VITEQLEFVFIRPGIDETDELIPLVYDQSQSGSAIYAIHIKRSVANRIIKESGYTIHNWNSV